MVIFVCVPLVARGQIEAPVLERHAFELGYAYQWYHRDATQPPIAEIQWDVATFYVRFGAFDWLSFVLEGGLWEVENDDFPYQIFDRYVVSGGLSARVWSAREWAVSLMLGYKEVWDDDASAYGFDKRVYRISAVAPLSRRFEIGAPLDAWLGPCYVDDTAENFPYNDYIVIRDEPTSHWGLSGGAQATLWGHFTILGSVQYVDYIEGLLGLGLRLGGEE